MGLKKILSNVSIDGSVTASSIIKAGSSDSYVLLGGGGSILLSSIQNYVLPAANTTTLGGIKLGDATVQTVAANAVTATASRSYGLQVNSSGQGIVNVPWTDTNTTYSSGTGLSLAGTVFSVNTSIIAALNSPAFTGAPTAPTAAAGTNTTQLATTAFVATAITNAASNYATSGHNHTLDALSNTTITSNTAGEILKWNGTAWINNTLAEAGIQATVTGGASSILTSNLTASRALASDASGKITVSGATSTELGYLAGVSSAIQNQINLKANSASPSFTGLATFTGNGEIIRVASTTATSFAEIHVSNDVNSKTILGSIGSTYTNADWANSAYLYNTTQDHFWIKNGKASGDFGVFTGGTALANKRFTISSTGAATFTSSVTASNFIGLGTELTGYAAGLSTSDRLYDGWINAPGYDANTMAINKVGFSYSNNAPYTGSLAYFGAGGYGFQFSSSYSGGNDLAFRTRNGDLSTWNAWKTILHTGNYSSYSTFAGVVTAPRFNWTGSTSTAAGTVSTESAFYHLLSDYGYGISTNTVGGLDIMANQTGQGIRFWAGTANSSPTKRLEIQGNGVVAATGGLIGQSLAVNQNDGAGYGLSLYGGHTGVNPSYGIMFALTATYGTHGSVTGDWATYFTMISTNNRGWIFKHDGVNRASISGLGEARFNGSITTDGNFVKTGGSASQFLKANGSVDGTAYTPTSRILTINGAAYDLSADRAWTISASGGDVFNGATTGYVPIVDTSDGYFLYNSSIYNAGGVSGNVIVGGTADNTFGKLQVVGNFYASGEIRAGGDVVAFYSSDKRLKDNILPIRNSIDKIKQIGGYTFDWNNKQTTYEGHDYGVIAQEIESIMPELVITRDNGYKAVKYEKIVPLLIEAIKDQQVQIEDLRTLIFNI